MPNFDGTGPRGNGPKTGRGLGNCLNKNSTSKTEDIKTNIYESQLLKKRIKDLEEELVLVKNKLSKIK
jgi:hypothetical protein